MATAGSGKEMNAAYINNLIRAQIWATVRILTINTSDLEFYSHT
jgi:hypothetical protein